jgi:hypothetical protein
MAEKEEGTHPDEGIIRENEYFILRALAIRSQIEAAMGVLLMADFVLFVVWLLVFLETEDNAWYNWIEFMQVFMWVGFLMLAAQSDNVDRNLKYMLVVSAMVFAVDLIIVAFVRPVGYDNVNPLNECKRHTKMILIVLQAFFTSIDFITLCLVIYYAYGSDLQKPAVMHRYQTINSSRLQYAIFAIKFALVEEWREQMAKVGQQIDAQERDNALRLAMIAKARAAAASAPEPAQSSARQPPPPLPAQEVPQQVQTVLVQQPVAAAQMVRGMRLGTPMGRQGKF